MRAALLAWYAGHRRALPWRIGADPYAIWVSEVMLQQTQAATVVPYFQRWMAALPTVRDLAAAPLADVLRLWQGLGYYARARHLHRAAQLVIADHGGQLPPTFDALRRLPGLGDYAAAAIAAIAFGERVPAVDGNVRRVISRLAAIEADVTRTMGRCQVAAIGRCLVDGPAPGDLNQALMELGAMVCTPRHPSCPACPVAGWCLARASGRQELLPRHRPRTPPRAEHRFAFLVTHATSGRLLVAHRSPSAALGGLWEFPMVVAAAAASPAAASQRPFGLALDNPRYLPVVAHAFTHRRLTVTPVAATTTAVEVGDPAGGYDDWRWVPVADLADLEASVLMRKLLGALEAARPGSVGRAGSPA